MVARSVDTIGPGVQGIRRGRRPAAVSSFGQSLTHSVVVVGPTVAGVVRSAGGWLFDQVMAGWDVVVLTSDNADPRPLRILGVATTDLEGFLATPPPAGGSHVIAVDAMLCHRDQRVKEYVSTLMEDPSVDVRLWNGHHPEAYDGVICPVPHQLSFAARAFKAHALAAVESAGTVADDALPDDEVQNIEMFAVALPRGSGRTWPTSDTQLSAGA